MFDTDLVSRYSTLELMSDGSGLSTIKECQGLRFTVTLQQPQPGFFFSVADLCDDVDECVFVINETKNLCGCYGRKDNEHKHG